MLGALLALAACWFDNSFEIFFALIVGDLFAGLNISPRQNPNAPTIRNGRFGVWLTGMVDTGSV